MADYYDRDGIEMTVDQWITDFKNMDKRRVAVDEVPPNVKISTVWLGLNHQYGEGPPMIFETMVFGGPMDGEMWRYSTEEEALSGHKRMYELVTKG